MMFHLSARRRRSLVSGPGSQALRGGASPAPGVRDDHRLTRQTKRWTCFSPVGEHMPANLVREHNANGLTKSSRSGVEVEWLSWH